MILVMSTHATAVFEIKTWDEKPYQEIEGGSKLTRASVTKAYRGDITGDATSESLMFYRADGSAVFAGIEGSRPVLVEFQAGHVPGFNFVSIEREFSGLLNGRHVDMVTPKFLNPRIRDQVLSSAEPLYVAT